ncbi:Thiamine-monophosphate kinase [Limihaloglobus sulfuriphilus]|uniref:Thiamine-monophosphate kinase n=1 Tax=Limihaloglobus sulfuriphilus TaxID=1851148 RepID=A0A1Q2MC45_9BACT|nr:thiamine-monophosphate kinase [Limihaloglobus sulfuriphilus]AQQ70276.1 Thiamine-monophosphate kinase [Limihaloglobus sulfuriphilus]
MSSESKITEYFAAAQQLDPVRFPIGIGDDMAQICTEDIKSVLVTTDMLLDGTHFDLSGGDRLELVGYKSMAASLSDCAAMASIPVAAVVSVALPAGFGEDKLKRLHAGILDAASRYNCPLIGGDITGWKSSDDRLAVSVTMFSKLPLGAEPIKRSTAQPGDRIYVTGSLGGSIRGRHLEFTPRIEEALRLRGLAKITAMMDISDGLSTDLNHICRLSGVGAVVYAEKIPVSSLPDVDLSSALNDGEDFELLFTVAAKDSGGLESGWKMPAKITCIGEVTDKKDVMIEFPDGRIEPLRAGGYDHLNKE